MNKDRINTTIDLVILMLYLVSSIFLCVQISFLDSLGTVVKYILVLLLIILLILFMFYIFVSKEYLMLKRVLLVVLTIIYTQISFNLYNKIQINNLNNQIYTYYRLNLVSDEQLELNEITIGILMNDRNYLLSFDDKNKAFNTDSCIYKEYHTMDKLIKDFENNKIQALVLSDQNIAYLNHRYPEVSKKLIYINENKHSVAISHSKKEIDLNKPFTILLNISNIDDLQYVSSTEQCYLMFIDPIIHKISFVKLPSNLYIPNIAYDSYPDALHNVSYNGIDNLLYSIEKMIDVNIDYFIKINPKTIINTIDIMQSIIISETEIIDGKQIEVKTTIDDGNIHNYLMNNNYDISNLLIGLFDEKDELIDAKLNNFIANFNNNTFSNMPHNILNELLFMIRILDCDIEHVELNELSISNQPCISYGGNEKFEVSIMDLTYIKRLYNCFIEMKHLELMDNFEFDLNYITNVSTPINLSKKIITKENMYWKIDDYFSVLPDSMIHPVEVEKWQGQVNFDEPNFDPDGIIYPIE